MPSAPISSPRSSDMSCEQLPPELICAIIDQLSGNRRALEACSIVCKAWSYPARYHIFHDNARVVIDADALAAILTSGSQVIPLIRHLFIPNLAKLFCIRDLQVPTHIAGFERLKSLRFAYLPKTCQIPKARELLNFGAITRLHLIDVCNLTSTPLAEVICAFSSLETLLVVGGCPDSEHSDSGWTISPTLSLPRSLCAIDLRYHSMRMTLECLVSFAEFPLIDNVHLAGIRPDYFSVLNRLLHALAPSLKVFSYTGDCDYIYEHEEYPIDLSRNTGLRSLRLELSASKDISDYTWMLGAMASTCVEDVTITFVHCDTVQDIAIWNQVDEILTRPSFSRLKRVDVGLSYRFNTTKYSMAMNEWLISHLPQCVARGFVMLGNMDLADSYL